MIAIDHEVTAIKEREGLQISGAGRFSNERLLKQGAGTFVRNSQIPTIKERARL